MKKVAKNSGANSGFRPVLSRKKRKGGVLAKNVLVEEDISETGNTTESESINMEEKCLVEKTSIDYGERDAFDGGDPNQTPKNSGLKIKTKKVLGKPLSKINFDDGFNDGVNGFGRASTPSKFGGIICATFTSEKAMMAAVNLANKHGIVINTDLKCPGYNHTNQTIVLKEISVRTSIEAVRAAVSEFGIIKSIKMQLVGLWQKAFVKLEDQNQANLLAFMWSILIGKDAVYVARADIDKQTWDSRNRFRTLFYTLLVGMNAHNL
ncbi:hypothetical protein G9A89_018309 [Geosiphon pyriformis]|nr:hypothetical protein G9A89_018309 [Geosiphon pyriformis]